MRSRDNVSNDDERTNNINTRTDTNDLHRPFLPVTSHTYSISPEEVLRSGGGMTTLHN